MAKQSDRGDLYILTAEEHDQRVKERKRKDLLDRLAKASADKKPKKAVTKKEDTPYQPPKKKTFDSSYGDYTTDRFEQGIAELGWDSFMDQVQNSYDFMSSTHANLEEEQILGSPIDVAAGENIAEFTRYLDEKEPYENLFKDEIAMTSEILKDLKEAGKLVSKKLKYMSDTKSAGGVTKSYSDLVTAATSIQSTKLSAIDKIAGWKLKREELKLKVKKEMPELEESVDSIVDQYYAKYVIGRSGGTSLQSEKSAQPPSFSKQSPSMEEEYEEEVLNSPNRALNLTSPNMWDNSSGEDDEEEVDPYGYIRHSGKGVEICIERLPGGSLSFVAIAANGEYLDDYEVPGQDMLDSVQISPISKYASDKAGRRYRIIDFENAIDLD